MLITGWHAKIGSANPDNSNLSGQNRMVMRGLTRKASMRLTCIFSRELSLLVVIGFWVGSLTPADPQVRRTFVRSGEPEKAFRLGGRWNARWVGQALVGIEVNDSSEPVIYRAGKDGHSERIVFRIPEAGHIYLNGVSSGPDGMLAVSGSAYSSDGKAGTFVAHIAPDRKQKVITRVWPFCPRVLTVAADGTIWSVGWVLDEAGATVATNVLKRFDASGKVLTTTIVQAKSRFSTGLGAVEYSRLASSRDRVGWITNKYEYIEFSLDGREIFRIDGPPFSPEHEIHTLSMALSSDNQVVVGTVGRSRWDLWTLDRDNRTWSRIEVTGGELGGVGYLLGFDGEELVTAGERDTIQRYKRLSSEEIRKE